MFIIKSIFKGAFKKILNCSLRYLFYFLLFFIIIAMGGCASSELQSPEIQFLSKDLNLFWPPSPQPPRIKYLGSITGSSDLGIKKSWIQSTAETFFGESEGRETLSRPYGVFSKSNILYITDTNSHVLHIFDLLTKTYNGMIRAFSSPIGVAVDNNGDIYITDSFLKRVFVYDKDRKYLRDIGSPDLFMRPTGICLDEGRIYIVDTLSHRVLIFNKIDGQLLFSFGRNGSQNGEFNYPVDIFLGRDKLLYITDSMNFRIQIFDRDGHFQSSFGKHGDGTGNFSKPKGIAVDSEGHIYVVDADFDVVQIFDKAGRLLLVFGSSGTNEGQLCLPTGIFIDENDRIYVSDSYNKRVQIFQYIKEEKPNK